MVMHPNTKYNWPISKDKNVMAWRRKYYLKKNYLTLRSKVKDPRRSFRDRTHRLIVMHPHTKYRWPISKDKNVMARQENTILKTIIWPWGQRSHEGHYGTRHTALWSCIYGLSVHEQFCWTYLNYLTLRSKVKVPQRSIWYATHHLMGMHPHTNYHWPISKDKKVMVWTSFAEKKRKKQKKRNRKKKSE